MLDEFIKTLLAIVLKQSGEAGGDDCGLGDVGGLGDAARLAVVESAGPGYADDDFVQGGHVD